MLSSLQKFHLPLVRECFENGIDLFYKDNNSPQELKARYKNIFSQIFSSKDSFPLQTYIIENIPDISIGNHIVIKTLLHKIEYKLEFDDERYIKRIELINLTLERYQELSNEINLDVKKIVSKRIDSNGKQIVNTYMNYLEYNEKFPIQSIKSTKSKI